MGQPLADSIPFMVVSFAAADAEFGGAFGPVEPSGVAIGWGSPGYGPVDPGPKKS